MRQETDPDVAMKLRQREVKILLELGQIPQAISAARALPPDGTGFSILADVLCHASRWKEAESVFEAARLARIEEGSEARAQALARGPLFLLAEARKDFGRCSELADLPVLAARVARLSGGTAEPAGPPGEEGFPWGTLAMLEACHAGADPACLPVAVQAWGRGEREWKWRVVFEGATLTSAAGLHLGPWRRLFRSIDGVVLDPRWPTERKALKTVLGAGGRT
ncbi:MAG: hypothetical protein R6V62_02555 [Candidatus Fermentibacteraceae bacterium]